MATTDIQFGQQTITVPTGATLGGYVRGGTNDSGATVLSVGDGTFPMPTRVGRKIAILGNSVTAQSVVPNGSGKTLWAESTAKSLTNTIVPCQMDLSDHWAHLYYTCTTAGTTGTVEPTWPKTVGETVTDGTVVWEATALRTDVPQFGWGLWTFAQALSGQRLDEVYIVGRSGKQSNDILLYLDAALAASPDVVFFSSIFENDCWPGSAPTLATIQARWDDAEAAMNRVRGLGKTVMLQTLLPSGYIDSASVFTTYAYGNGSAAWLWLNDKIREYARNNTDVILWDAANVYVDSNPANPVYPENTVTYLSQAGAGQALKKTDGIHPYTSAIYLLAKSLAAVLVDKFPSVSRFSNALDKNTLSKNPLNYGTSGTAGTGVTSGTPANLMTLNAYGATTAVLSKVARTDISGEWQQCVYDSAAADSVNYPPATAYTLAAPFAVGDSIQSFAEIKILANPVLLTQVALLVQPTGGSLPSDFRSCVMPSTAWQDIGQMITEDTVFTLKTVPFKIQTGTTGYMTYPRVVGRGAASFTVQFGRVSIVKTGVTDIA